MTRLPLILAIDPAISCGWAVGDAGAGAGGLQRSGAWKLADPKDHPGQRFARLAALIREVHLTTPISLVVYESGFHRGAAATRSHWGLVGVILGVAARYQLEVLAVNPSQLKAHVGDGANDKVVMMRRCKLIYGRDCKTSDEADAIWLYDYARHLWKVPRVERAPQSATQDARGGASHVQQSHQPQADLPAIPGGKKHLRG
ncbi:MAG TPA: hypothetical protein VGK94_07855 [Candidatus Polarisedimenticolia bacterium]|jgi:Holliday junction resolvasome RuvABC endonuclease subunit